MGKATTNKTNQPKWSGARQIVIVTTLPSRRVNGLAAAENFPRFSTNPPTMAGPTPTSPTPSSPLNSQSNGPPIFRPEIVIEDRHPRCCRRRRRLFLELPLLLPHVQVCMCICSARILHSCNELIP